MSIIKDVEKTNKPEQPASPTAIEEIAKFLEAADGINKRVRAADRKVKQLGNRLFDLKEDDCETRALKRASADLSDLDIAALKDDTTKLIADLEAAGIGPTKAATEATLRTYKRRSIKLQGELEEAEESIKEIDRVVTAAEDKVDTGSQKETATSEFTVTTADDAGQMSAKMMALQLFPEYKAAGFPPLKTADKQPIAFAVVLPRADGSIRSIIIDPATASTEDLTDMKAGLLKKKAFTPLDGMDGLVAKELAVMAHNTKLW